MKKKESNSKKKDFDFDFYMKYGNCKFCPKNGKGRCK